MKWDEFGREDGSYIEKKRERVVRVREGELGDGKRGRGNGVLRFKPSPTPPDRPDHDMAPCYCSAVALLSHLTRRWSVNSALRKQTSVMTATAPTPDFSIDEYPRIRVVCIGAGFAGIVAGIR